MKCHKTVTSQPLHQLSRAEYLFVQCPRGRKSFEKFPNCLLCQIWIIRYRKQSWPETTLNRFGHIDPCDRVDNKEGGGNKGDHSNEIMNGVFKFHFTLPTSPTMHAITLHERAC